MERATSSQRAVLHLADDMQAAIATLKSQPQIEENRETYLKSAFSAIEDFLVTELEEHADFTGGSSDNKFIRDEFGDLMQFFMDDVSVSVQGETRSEAIADAYGDERRVSAF